MSDNYTWLQDFPFHQQWHVVEIDEGGHQAKKALCGYEPKGDAFQYNRRPDRPESMICPACDATLAQSG